MDNYLKKQVFKRGATESNLYLKIKDENMIIVVVYVDDIIFGSNLQILSVNFASEMKKEFEMSMLGEIPFFLGLQLYHIDKGIFISQTKYIKDMLKRFNMEDSKPVSTPMITGFKLSKEDESLEADHTMYRSMIGNMLYVIATRPDVMQDVGLFSRFQSSPKETHITTLKCIKIFERYYGVWVMVPKNSRLRIESIY